MPNTNCLAGLRCPQCGSYEPFSILGQANVVVYDEGTDEGSSIEWDYDSHARCIACGKIGKVGDFLEEDADEDTK